MEKKHEITPRQELEERLFAVLLATHFVDHMEKALSGIQTIYVFVY
jgi:hypothetical protein